MYKFIFSFIFILISFSCLAQEQRLADHNSIGWFAYTGSFKIKPRLAIHTEFQWRRVHTVNNWQQGLYRTGLNYSLNKDVNIIAGYAHAGTYRYGDYPAAFNFPEHRFYEQLIIKNPVGRVNISHRFTLEQRFVGVVTLQNAVKHTDYNYLNRLRYRVRAEIPLQNKAAANQNWSFAIQDEIFVGWGKNLGANVFDQNRIGLLLGYKLNNNAKFEAGYINQTLQQGKRVNNLPVFQYNNGFLISGNFSFDLTK